MQDELQSSQQQSCTKGNTTFCASLRQCIVQDQVIIYSYKMTLNCEAELLVMCDWPKGDPNRLRQGPLIILTGEREWILSRHLHRFKKVAVFQTNRR